MNIKSTSALTFNGPRGRRMIAAGAATLLAASALVTPAATAQTVEAEVGLNSAEANLSGELNNGGSADELASSAVNGRTVTVAEDGTLEIDTDLAVELAELLRTGTQVSLVTGDGTSVELELEGDAIIARNPSELAPGVYLVRAGGSSSPAELSSGSSDDEDTTPGRGEGSADELASSALLGSSLSSLGGLGVASSAAELSSGSSDDEDTTPGRGEGSAELSSGSSGDTGEGNSEGSGNGTSEGSSRSSAPDGNGNGAPTTPGTSLSSGSSALSSSEDGIPDNCVAAGLTVGIPLALLVPVAVGNQVNIPGLESMSTQVNLAIQDMNTQVQQGLGVYSDQAAAVAEQFNINVGSNTGDVARIAGSAAALAVAAAAGYYLYENCTA